MSTVLEIKQKFKIHEHIKMYILSAFGVTMLSQHEASENPATLMRVYGWKEQITSYFSYKYRLTQCFSQIKTKLQVHHPQPILQWISCL